MKTMILSIALALTGAAYAQQAPQVVVPCALDGSGYCQPVQVIVPIVASQGTGSLVLKTSPGYLYEVDVTPIVTPGFLMVFDAAGVPPDGPVSPKECLAVKTGETTDLRFYNGPPEQFVLGIAAAFSSTGCFTKTEIPAAFLHGAVQ
jgi:hypothetical protein